MSIVALNPYLYGYIKRKIYKLFLSISHSLWKQVYCNRNLTFEWHYRNASSQFQVKVHPTTSGEYEERTQYSSTCYTQESCTLNCPGVSLPPVKNTNITSNGITWHKVLYVNTSDLWVWNLCRKLMLYVCRKVTYHPQTASSPLWKRTTAASTPAPGLICIRLNCITWALLWCFMWNQKVSMTLSGIESLWLIYDLFSLFKFVCLFFLFAQKPLDNRWYCHHIKTMCST